MQNITCQSNSAFSTHRKFKLPNDNTSSQRLLLHHLGCKEKKKKHYAGAWKGLTGSRLSLMQIVREIRLPVRVMVNGSHRSPPLTVNRKSQSRVWPRPHKRTLSDCLSDAHLTYCHGQSDKVSVHLLNWLHNFPPSEIMWESQSAINLRRLLHSSSSDFLGRCRVVKCDPHQFEKS